MAWTPVLSGDLAEAATRRAREIAEELAASRAGDPGDRALFWAYASAVFDEAFASDAYGAALDELIAELRRGTQRLGLFGGLAGHGFTLCHVLDADDSADALAAIDDALLRLLAVEPWPAAHDLIEGLVGFGVYFLERIAAGAGDSARAGLGRVVAQLARTAETTAAGATWHTPLALLPSSYAGDYPDGFHDCGLAHGVPGMIAFLARASAHDGGARALCLDATRWIEAQRADGRFPGKVVAGTPEPARTAWCYGDPGVATGLLAAALRLGTPPSLAITTALAAIARDVEDAGVRDAGLCHGAAGLAHLSNRFFHATGDAAFAEHARVWLARALAMDRPADPGFLEGASGVGLALLAATTFTEPAWDRLLLCDLPLPDQR